MLILVLRLTCLYCLRFIVLITATGRSKLSRFFTPKIIWVLFIIVLIYNLKVIPFYLKTIKNFRLININLLIYIVYGFILMSMIPKFKLSLINNLHNAILSFITFKIEDVLLRFNAAIIYSISKPSSKFLGYFIIILFTLIGGF